MINLRISQRSKKPIFESRSVYIATESETQVLAREFAGQLQRGDIVALHGDLGAGKTTFVKGIVGVLSPENLVQSPTFIYLN
nr:tRNA threonylcarbamoyladenosine biosynthesis protein TsaE [Chlamydiota bacterium]